MDHDAVAEPGPTPKAPPASLAPEVARAREAWRQAAGRVGAVDSSAALPSQTAFDRLLACSPFAAGVLIRSPERVAVLRQGPDALADGDRPPTAEEGLTDAVFRARLRRYRNTMMMRLVFDSLAGPQALEGVLDATSRLADQCIQLAVSQAHRRLANRFGEPRDAAGRPLQVVTLAMGKLGGRELNFSSDVDLIFLYPRAGVTDGARSLGNDEFFDRLVRLVVNYLDERTADGFVFRVDTRLRPFGLSGAPVQSFAALEAYLQGHARDWERYAYVRARPVTGAHGDRHDAEELIRPFVFRRYLDYSVLESVRDIRGRIAAEAKRRDARNDLKVGEGGIREIEFIVQTFQILHGGRDLALRSRNTLRALDAIVERGLLPAGAGARLGDSYRRLRHIENAVQMIRDEQTHMLPSPATDRDRVACHLNYTEWDGLAGELSDTRAWVVGQFADAVIGDAPPRGLSDDFQDLIEGRLGRDELVSRLQAQGVVEAEAVAEMLERMHRAAWYTRLTQQARARLQEVIPAFLQVAAEMQVDAATCRRVLDVLEAVGSRSVYFALLSERREALRHLVQVCQLGPAIAGHLMHTPALIDALLDPALLAEPPSGEELARELARRLGAVPEDDEEGVLDALRYFQHQAIFQIGVADLLGLLEVSAVSDLLTQVAELLLVQALASAREQLAQPYGHPRDEQGNPVEFAVLAYGKLGGCELGYGSDLDIVFLHGDAPARTDGPRELSGEVYFRRLAQRVIHILSTQTAASALYQVDMRLRPSGNAGLLVTSLAAFATYQDSQAWTWEHQALLRARTVAGDEALCAQVEDVRRAVLCRERDVSQLRADVLSMRERMREAAGSVAAPGCFDVKRDPGGLVDIEFIVQYLVLASAHRYPELIEGRDNASQLRRLGQLGVLEIGEAEGLAVAYERLRGLTHRAALRGDTHATASLDDAAQWVELVTAAFAKIVGAVERAS